MKVGISGFELGHVGGTSVYLIQLLQALGHLDMDNAYEIWCPKRSVHMLPILPSNFNVTPVTESIRRTIPSILWHNLAFPIHNRMAATTLWHIPHLCRMPLVKTASIVGTMHDMTAFNVPNRQDRLRVFYHRHLLSRLIHRCDLIIAVSKTIKHDLVRFTGYPAEKVSVIYSGIDHSTFYPRDPEAAKSHLNKCYGLNFPFLLYVARLEYFKNHLNLISGFNLFKKKFKTDHHLILAGADDIDADKIKEAAQNSPFKEQIHFLGCVPSADIVQLNTACDLMVFPSFYEGFSLAIVEAMACRTPILCSKIPPFEELPEKGVWKCNPEDPRSISEAIADALGDSRRPEKIEHSRQFALSLTWPDTASQVHKVYQQL